MKSADFLAGREADSLMDEGGSLRPLPNRTGPQWDRLRFHFATAVDELKPGSRDLASADVDEENASRGRPAQDRVDQYILAKATQRLRTSGYRALRTIRCECEQGILRLRGSVNSFFHLQLAQELVRRVEGIDEFLIDVEVLEVDGRNRMADDR